MPILLAFSVLIAIYFSVHAFRTQQNYYWIGLMLGMPFLGSLIYFLVIYLPDIRQTRVGYELEGKLRKAIDPMKSLREAEKAYQVSPNVENKLRLANALVESGRSSEALDYYKEIITLPLYKEDHNVLYSYATALFENGSYNEAKDILNKLFVSSHTDQNNNKNIKLLYAKTLALLNEQANAKQIFKELMEASPSLESQLVYANTLAYWNEIDEAKEVITQLEKHFALLPKHTQRLNKETIKQARALMKSLQ